MSGERSVVEVPPAIMMEVFAHARETYPQECCGFLVGPAEPHGLSQPFHVDQAVRCDNKQNQMHALDPATFQRDARTAYFFGAEDSRALDKSLRKGSERVTRVIYHSHCDVGDYFSSTDKKAALMEGEPLYPTVTYLVVDAALNGVMGAKLFAWNAQRRDFLAVAHFDPFGQRIRLREYV